MQSPAHPIKLSATDWLIEGLSLILFLAGIVYGGLNYASLPKTIPTNFGISGQPDGFGEKYNLLIVMGVNVLAFGLMSLAYKFPALINYPFQLTPENEERHFKNAYRMIGILKLFVPLLFGEIIYSTIQTFQGNQNGLGSAMLVIFFGMIFSLGFFMYRGYLISNRK